MVLHYVNSIDFFPSITVNHCEKIAFQVDGFTLNLIILIIPQSNHGIFYPYIPGDTELVYAHGHTRIPDRHRDCSSATCCVNTPQIRLSPLVEKPLPTFTQVLFWNTSNQHHSLDPTSVFASSCDSSV